jgi:hypothetical protein
MNIFRAYTYSWWQISIFKIALLSIGVAIGTYWQEFWSAHLPTLFIVAAVSTAYIMYVSFRQ